MRPDPKLWRGSWVVDLRAAGFGQRYVLGPGDLPREEAVNLAWEKLSELRGERMAEAPARDLFSEAAPEGLAATLDIWVRQKRYDTPGGEAWGKKYTRIVRRELGARALQDFAPPHGAGRLDAYVRELEALGKGARTVRNRLSILYQVLALAASRGWLPLVPRATRLPPKPAPVFHYLNEEMFRRLRAAIYSSPAARWSLQGQQLKEPVEHFIERRRVYLSWLMYTGSHTRDADEATADDLFLDGGGYLRHNRKSAKCVGSEQFEMPEPLQRDLFALQELLGRPFMPGERFAGGPWRHVADVMQRAAKELGFSHGANPRIMRRSYAREMFLRGYEVHEIADRMGHVDDRMLREIYARTPRGAGTAKSRWTVKPVAPTAGTPNGMARVLKLRSTGGDA